MPKWPSVDGFLGLGLLSHKGFWLLNMYIFFHVNILKQFWKTNSLSPLPRYSGTKYFIFFLWKDITVIMKGHQADFQIKQQSSFFFFSVTEHESDITAHLPSLQHWTVKWTAVCVYLSCDIEHPNLRRRSSAFPFPDYFTSCSEQTKLFADERRHLPKTRLSDVSLDHTTALHLSVF